MKWLSAGLTFVNCSTLCGLLLGVVAGGLGPSVAILALFWGIVAAIFAYLTTNDSKTGKQAADLELSSKTRQTFWFWFLAACFACFAFRSFCWLLFSDGEHLRIQSPNNLGDLALHIAYIRHFASGISLWPSNPIYIVGQLRYPAGIDVFNALLTCLHIDLARGLIWTGLLASLATFYAFYRWGGVFGIAGFLFNGGLAGFQFFNFHGGLDFLNNLKFIDYQAQGIAWKSIPLAMFVTQRGLLYALPAGLLLLWHWREKFFCAPGQDRLRTGLPFWIELSLYASMPLFHIHTFMALSLVLAILFAFEFLRESGFIGNRVADEGKAGAHWKQIGLLVGSALIPATFFVWLVTDHFRAKSVVKLVPGLLMKDEFATTFWRFWPNNFGLWIPLAILLVVVCLWRVVARKIPLQRWPLSVAFILAATVIFGIANCVKLAPWEWDNTKILIWAYFIALPFLWTELISKWDTPIRAGLCVALFTSGFVSLFGGLAPEKPGFEFASRGEIYTVDVAVRKLPLEARFAAFPTYNHPLLLNGRKVVMGYPGHLWTQGFVDYADVQAELTSLMQGEDDWMETAKHLGVRYIFWGQEEKANYPNSARPWEKTLRPIAFGNWGLIFDLEPAASAGAER